MHRRRFEFGDALFKIGAPIAAKVGSLGEVGGE